MPKIEAFYNARTTDSAGLDLSYREYLKWQYSFRKKTDGIRHNAGLRQTPIARRMALPNPQGSRDRSFKPNGELDLVRKRNFNADKQRRVAVRMIKVFDILYDRDASRSNVERVSNLLTRVCGFWERWGMFLMVICFAPIMGTVGIIFLAWLFSFNLCQVIRYIYWDWTLSPSLVVRPQ
ncbi:hypothetical protein TWF481_009219 [Arthrobotrys musiformis]|uniref:Uncharacterized protein n=1 Tax=Arthrobotrys musiformis TaxID=47236 RepID=A0AAV9W429_9PEZI